MLKDYTARVKDKERDILTILCVISVSVIGFCLGRISYFYDNKAEISISGELNGPIQPIKSNISQSASIYVGSKSGTVYHLSNCPGAKSIREENKIYFNTEEEAKTAGYRPAANCPGLR